MKRITYGLPTTRESNTDSTSALLMQPRSRLVRPREFHIDHPSARDSSCVFFAHLCAAHTASPVPVIRENVISCLRHRVAREPALGVVPLRRLVSQGAGRDRIGCRDIEEHGASPPAAVHEPLAVLDHEVDVMLGAW